MWCIFHGNQHFAELRHRAFCRICDFVFIQKNAPGISDLESYTWIVLWSILHKKQLFLTRTTFVIRLILLEWIIFISNSFPNDSSFDVAQHVFIYFGFDSVLQCQFALYLLENIIIYSSRQINAVKKLVLHFKKLDSRLILSTCNRNHDFSIELWL